MNRALNILTALLALLVGTIPAPPCHAQQDIVLGMSADFSGPVRHLGVELYRGAALYLDQVNRDGGVHGRRLVIEAMDDGYAPTPAITNTVELVEKRKVFALFNYVGTPTTTRVLPLLRRYSRQDIPLLFPLTGAQILRQAPYDRYVYNFRASYADEATELVNRFVAIGRRRIAMLYQIDTFGRGAWDSVRSALAEHGLHLAGEASYHRGADFGADMRAQVEIIAQGRPDAVIVASTSEACAAFARDARSAGLDAPIAVLSFASGQDILDLLRRNGRQRCAANIISSMVVPWHENSTLPAAREFRRLMREHQPVLPTELEKSAHAEGTPNPVAFEGFLNAKLLVEALRRMGALPDRSRLPHILRNTGPFDIGIGTPVRFAADGNQAMNHVYFATLEREKLRPLTDFERWRP